MNLFLRSSDFCNTLYIHIKFKKQTNTKTGYKYNPYLLCMKLISSYTEKGIQVTFQ